MNSTAMEKWTSKWEDYDFNSEYAAKRIKSAQGAKLTPILVNKDDCFAYFQGGHGRYETFLDYCPCGDSRGGKTPCKHIYRLAMELGILDVPFKTDENAVPVPREEKKSVEDTISLIESFPEDAQRLLLKIASSVSSKEPTFQMAVNGSDAEAIRYMSKYGIVKISSEKEKISFGKKDELLAFLFQNGYEADKKLKKADLEAICTDLFKEKSAEHFGSKIAMKVSVPTDYSSRTIHFYLHRKYGDDLRMGDNGEWIRTQMLQTVLPDDAITEQLIKYGYYSR